MYKKMIDSMSHDELKTFTIDFIKGVKEEDYELYEDVMEDLYEQMYGCHFSEWLLEKATSNMENEDGTHGEHWTLEQTTDVAKQYDIKFEHFNKYDWNYVMNMIYSDYYGAVSNDLSSYVKLSKKFLMDKDADEGKAYHYYIAMKR